MSKLSEPMIAALVSLGKGDLIKPGSTRDALVRRSLAKWTNEADKPARLVITPSGRHALDEIERAEREQRERAERASRPVPAGAFVEPSARTAPVLGHEYEDETGFECGARYAYPGRTPYVCERDAGHEGDHRGTNGTAVAAWDDRSPHALSALKGAPEIKAERVGAAELEIRAGDAVPQAWVDQLVTLLDAGARIVREVGSEWWLASGPVPFQLHPDRVHEAAREAIRRGIAQALPPTPGGGVVRLALIPKD